MGNDQARLTCGRFLSWCRGAGMATNDLVATVFTVTSQTVRNWARRPASPVPRWVELCVHGYEAWVKGPLGRTVPVFPQPTRSWFESWSVPRGMSTYAAMGAPFGQSRQTVHKWFKGELPRWLPLACIGVEAVLDGAMPPWIDVTIL